MTIPALLLSLFCLTLPVSIAGLNIAAALLSLWVLWTARSPQDWRPIKDPAVYALLLYCGVCALAAAAGQEPSRGFWMLRKDFHKVWILTVLLMTLSRERAPGAWRPLAAGFAFAACVGLYQVALSARMPIWSRAHAFVHPVTFGELMALGLLGGLCFLRRSWPKKPGLAAAWMALLAAALFLSQTRAALIGLATGFAAAAWIDVSLRKWAWRLAAAAACAALAWQALPMGDRSLGLILHPGLWSAGGRFNPNLARLQLWSVAWRMFLDHPWLGVGPGCYQTAFASYFHGLIDGQAIWGSAHNLLLHQLAERGIVGLAALLIALATLTVLSYRGAKRSPNPWTLWSFSALAAFWIMNMTEVAFQNEQAATFILFVWAWGRANETGPGKIL